MVGFIVGRHGGVAIRDHGEIHVRRRRLNGHDGGDEPKKLSTGGSHPRDWTASTALDRGHQLGTRSMEKTALCGKSAHHEAARGYGAPAVGSSACPEGPGRI